MRRIRRRNPDKFSPEFEGAILELPPSAFWSVDHLKDALVTRYRGKFKKEIASITDLEVERGGSSYYCEDCGDFDKIAKIGTDTFVFKVGLAHTGDDVFSVDQGITGQGSLF